VRISEIFYPSSLNELLELAASNPGIKLLAGGTELAGRQTSRALEFPEQIVSIARIPELRKTARSEQYVEVGSATTLSGLLSLSSGALPFPLPAAIHTIANGAVRNAATLGGNLCCKWRFMDLWPFLTCLDAQIELRSRHVSRWANLGHLCDEKGLPSVPNGAILTRVRIPVHEHNFVFQKKIGNSRFPSPETASFVCIADIDQNKIGTFKLIFAGEKALRNKDIENSLIGRRIPLTQKESQQVIEAYSEAFEKLTGHKSFQLDALVEESLSRLVPL